MITIQATKTTIFVLFIQLIVANSVFSKETYSDCCEDSHLIYEKNIVNQHTLSQPEKKSEACNTLCDYNKNHMINDKEVAVYQMCSRYRYEEGTISDLIASSYEAILEMIGIDMLPFVTIHGHIKPQETYPPLGSTLCLFAVELSDHPINKKIKHLNGDEKDVLIILVDDSDICDFTRCVQWYGAEVKINGYWGKNSLKKGRLIHSIKNPCIHFNQNTAVNNDACPYHNNHHFNPSKVKEKNSYSTASLNKKNELCSKNNDRKIQTLFNTHMFHDVTIYGDITPNLISSPNKDGSCLFFIKRSDDDPHSTFKNFIFEAKDFVTVLSDDPDICHFVKHNLLSKKVKISGHYEIYNWGYILDIFAIKYFCISLNHENKDEY